LGRLPGGARPRRGQRSLHALAERAQRSGDLVQGVDPGLGRLAHARVLAQALGGVDDLVARLHHALAQVLHAPADLGLGPVELRWIDDAGLAEARLDAAHRAIHLGRDQVAHRLEVLLQVREQSLVLARRAAARAPAASAARPGVTRRWLHAFLAGPGL